MTFAQMSAGAVLAGLAALAAALFFLQRLRVRRRPVRVATTLFWREAAGEAPARMLTERFRHPAAYALALLIASLLWVAFARPAPGGASVGDFRTLVLDGSAGMAAGDRFERAAAALARHVAALPSSARQVVWSGATVRTLLNPGEHPALLARRLEGLRPEPAPSRLETLIRDLARTGGRGEVIVFGDAPLRPASVPDGIRVSRAASGARPATRNAGITGLGVAEAASGAWDRVDILVRVVGDAAPPVVTLEGTPLPAGETSPDGLLFRDVPAAGGLLSARVRGGDALSADDEARLRLPSRPPLRVLLASSLESALLPALAADQAVELVAERPGVAVRRAGEAVASGVPALVVVPADAGTPAFRIRHPATLDPELVLREAVRATGLREIDAGAIADATRRPVEVEVASAPAWGLELREDLLADHHDFTRTRAFPLFLAQSVRWLAGVERQAPQAAAGETLGTESTAPAPRFLGGSGKVIDPLGVPFTPAAAGELRRADGGLDLAVSLLDHETTIHPAAGSEDTGVGSPSATAAHPAFWLLLAALLLLGLEWHLLQTGRIP